MKDQKLFFGFAFPIKINFKIKFKFKLNLKENSILLFSPLN